jgi:Flp pilus assembly secretin CpaC
MKRFKSVLFFSFALALLAGSIWLYGLHEEHRIRGLAQSIANDINDPDVPIRYIQNTIVLEGHVPTEADRSRAENIATAYQTGFSLRNLWQAPKILNLIELRP